LNAAVIAAALFGMRLGMKPLVLLGAGIAIFALQAFVVVKTGVEENRKEALTYYLLCPASLLWLAMKLYHRFA
jgi:hypothetical protein